MEKKQTFEELKILITNVFGITDIDFNTEINNLNTVSEDNDRFIELFQSKFNVDLSSFPYYKYFKEDEFILLSLASRIFRKGIKEKKKLTVCHLLNVIEKGKWFE